MERERVRLWLFSSVMCAAVSVCVIQYIIQPRSSYEPTRIHIPASLAYVYRVRDVRTPILCASDVYVLVCMYVHGI